MWIRRLLRHLLTLCVTVLLGGLLGATLVRLAPGFGVDQQELNTQLNQASIQILRQSHAGEQDILRYYTRYLGGLVHGDLGVSGSLGRPVRELLAERLPVTLRSVALGLLGGWLFASALALAGVMWRGWACDVFTTVVSGLFLCLPSAVLALVFLYFGGPIPLAIALVVFPQVFRYCRNLLLKTYNLPHVLTAKAKGLGGTRILFWHVVPSAAPPLLALVGVSVSMAFGAAIPIEVICDSPGMGQLAWQAAVARDLPLLVNMTLIVTLFTLTANSASDLACKALLRQPA
jgi:peptide/nickel transport system permease protein